MSQNRTVIQGLEPSDAPSYGSSSANSNFYSRREGGTARGTVVPGMMDNPTGNITPNSGAQAQIHKTVQTGKPIVGFLYSVSRTAAGEYWPLHIGQNTIGQSSACDIILPEATVSSEHAVLVVRKLKKPEKIIASISDARSTNGTMLDGESLGFAAVECYNGNIITIGDNYELFLILIDAASLGLTLAENFIPTTADEAPEYEQEPPIHGYTRPGDDTQAYNGSVPPAFGGGFTPSGGTVGLDGSSTSNNKGGTVGM